MRGRVAVVGESHPLSHHDAGINGNHAQSQLGPAEISVEAPIFDLGFFFESLAELKGTRKIKLSKKKTQRKCFHFPRTLQVEFFPILCVGFIWKP
jgi:hypothetical protein